MNDVINSCFEFSGAIVIWINILKLYKDKEIKGILWQVWIFYTVWGIWNLYYYPALNQTFSFYAGVCLVVGNIIWCIQAFYYNVKNREKI
jgi:hypothetical protein